MTHTDEEIKAAEERLKERLSAGHTFEMHNVSDLRAVADAAAAVEAANAILRERVQIARAHGHSWNRLAIPLGVSRQAARQRFGTPDDRTSEVAAGGQDNMVAASTLVRALADSLAELSPETRVPIPNWLTSGPIDEGSDEVEAPKTAAPARRSSSRSRVKK